MLENLSSAAVVIGALRVKFIFRMMIKVCLTDLDTANITDISWNMEPTRNGPHSL